MILLNLLLKGSEPLWAASVCENENFEGRRRVFIGGLKEAMALL
jgi:hypothetical protein